MQPPIVILRGMHVFDWAMQIDCYCHLEFGKESLHYPLSDISDQVCDAQSSSALFVGDIQMARLHTVHWLCSPEQLLARALIAVSTKPNAQHTSKLRQ